MLVRVETEQKQPKKKGPPKSYAIIICDGCGLEYRRDRNIKMALQSNIHFHDKACMNVAAMKDGILAKKKAQTNMRRLGVEHPLQSSIVITKMKVTCLEKYSVDNPLKSVDIRKTIAQTNIDRYGVENVFASDVVKERICKTWLQKYGYNHHMKSEVGKEHHRQCFMSKYGVDNAMKIDDVKVKFDFKAVWRKAHETKKKNGTYATSRAEQRFYEFLLQIFVTDDIERFKMVNNWSIDFYIKSIDAYIQFDGIYWHGLDRPIEKIRESKHERDVTISKAYERDRLQDVWFNEKGLKLVRVTDKEFRVALKTDASVLIERIR